MTQAARFRELLRRDGMVVAPGAYDCITAKLIEQAGLAKTRVGGAEVSERDGNFIVAYSGASARDIARLIDLVRARVQERFNVELEPEIAMW